jgi:hypothetical protein
MPFNVLDYIMRGYTKTGIHKKLSKKQVKIIYTFFNFLLKKNWIP